MKKIRILIADNHKLMRMGLESLIAGKSDMKVVGEAKNGEEAVELARELRPDVIVMDLMMPRLSGAEISQEFGISENTVKHTVTAIFAKLGVSSRAEASALAYRKHLLNG